MTTTELSTVNEYISSLSDLKTNFKPLINMLTILAEENVEYAPAIVQAIENHLQQAKRNSKLPVFYLIDSIVKNVGGDYRSLFARNMVNTFCSVFEKVDEDTRVGLRKLRRTWNDVFPAKNLSLLDVRVGLVDSSCSTSVALAKPTSVPVRRFELPSSDTVTASESATQDQLIVKRELLDLEMQKIELELLQAKMSLEQQRRQLEDFMALTSLPTNHPGSSNGPRIEPVVSKAIASVRPVTRDPSKTIASFRDRALVNPTSRLQQSDSESEGSETVAGTHRASSVSHISKDHFSAPFATTQSGTIIVDEIPKNYFHSDIDEMTSARHYDNFDIPMVVDSVSNSESLERNKIKDVRCESQEKDYRIMGNGTKIAENLLIGNSTVDSINSSLSSPERDESIDGIVDSTNSSLARPQRDESIEGLIDSTNSLFSNPQRHESIEGIVDSTNSSLSSFQRHETIDGIVDSTNSSLAKPQRHDSIYTKSVDATDARSSSSDERFSDSMKPFQRKLGCKSSSRLSQGSPSKKRKTNRCCESPNWSESDEKENGTIPCMFRSRTSSKDAYQSSKSRRKRFQSGKRTSRIQHHDEATVNSTWYCASGVTGEDHLISPMVYRSPLKRFAPVGRLQDSQLVGSTRREYREYNGGGFHGFKSNMNSKCPRRPGVMGRPDRNRFLEATKTPTEPSLTVQMEVDEKPKNHSCLTVQMEVDEKPKKPAILPVLFDEPETLKVRQPMIVTALYSGIQCGTCGVRFDSKHVTEYRLHLDWHFRQNRKKRESGRKPSSQQLYYNLKDWMEFTLVEDSANRTLSFFETAKQSDAITQRGADDSSRATTTIQPSILCRSGGDSWCKVCQDTFEEFYDDEEEAWCLRPTVNHEGTNYHPLCLDDYKRSSKKSPLTSMKEKENLQIREDMMDGAKDSVLFGKEEIKQELSNIPSVEKGHEISALCSIM